MVYTGRTTKVFLGVLRFSKIYLSSEIGAKLRLRAAYFLRGRTFYSWLVTTYSLLLTRYFFLVTRYCLLVTCCLLLVIRYFLLASRSFLPVTSYYHFVLFYGKLFVRSSFDKIHKSSLLNCVSYVPTCQRALLLTWSHANMPYMLACSRANMSCVLTCSPANLSCVLTCSRANVPYVLTCSRANVPCVPKYSRAITSDNKSNVSMACFT